MDFPFFPDLPDVSWAPLTMVIGFFIIIVFSVGSTFASGFRNEEKAATALFIGGGVGGITFLVGMGVLIFSMVGMTNAVADWKKAAIAEVEETYGIELTASDFYDLGFPKHEPEDDFVAYGSINRTERAGDTFEKRELTLIWAVGELFLAESVDGEEFVPLETR